MRVGCVAQGAGGAGRRPSGCSRACERRAPIRTPRRPRKRREIGVHLLAALIEFHEMQGRQRAAGELCEPGTNAQLAKVDAEEPELVDQGADLGLGSRIVA